MPEIAASVDNIMRQYAGVPVMVLGASGFIGRWVARMVCRSGAELILPVRETASAGAIFRDYGIEGQIYEIDLRDLVEVGQMIRETRPAIIFNLAGYGIDRTENSADLARQINTDLVGAICGATAEIRPVPGWGGQRIIHAGSAMEYGAVAGDLREDSDTRPTTLYGRSKLAGTTALVRCCRRERIKGIAARLFAVYGAGERPERLLPALLDAAACGKPIALTAGLHKRDFTYVEDAAEGLLRLGVSVAGPGQIVNVATGVLTSIREFANTAAEFLGLPGTKLIFGALPTRTEEMHHDAVNVTKLMHLTDWFPPTPIAEGIRQTLLADPVHKRNQSSVVRTNSICGSF